MYNWIILFKTSEIYSAIILITVIFIVLSSGVVLFVIRFKVKQGLHFQEKKKMAEEFSKQLMQSQIEVQEATMSMIGQELHDNICQQISSTKLIVAYALRRPEETKKMLIEIEGHLGKTINDIRLLTKSMDKEWLEKFDLVANLETEVNRINASKMLNMRMDTSNRLPLESDKQLMLFRIIQEALQNAIRHAGASQIEIEISTDNDNINTLIKDNGKGFAVDGHTTGMGIRNMKHRTDLLKGNITWTSADKGSIVHISIPLSEQSNEN